MPNRLPRCRTLRWPPRGLLPETVSAKNIYIYNIVYENDNHLGILYLQYVCFLFKVWTNFPLLVILEISTQFLQYELYLIFWKIDFYFAHIPWLKKKNTFAWSLHWTSSIAETENFFALCFYFYDFLKSHIATWFGINEVTFVIR